MRTTRERAAAQFAAARGVTVGTLLRTHVLIAADIIRHRPGEACEGWVLRARTPWGPGRIAVAFDEPEQFDTREEQAGLR